MPVYKSISDFRLETSLKFAERLESVGKTNLRQKGGHLRTEQKKGRKMEVSGAMRKSCNLSVQKKSAY